MSLELQTLYISVLFFTLLTEMKVTRHVQWLSGGAVASKNKDLSIKTDTKNLSQILCPTYSFITVWICILRFKTSFIICFYYAANNQQIQTIIKSTNRIWTVLADAALSFLGLTPKIVEKFGQNKYICVNTIELLQHDFIHHRFMLWTQTRRC